MRLRDSASSTKPVVVPKRKPPSAAYWLLALVLPIAFFTGIGRLDAPKAIAPEWAHTTAAERVSNAPTPAVARAVTSATPVSLPRTFRVAGPATGQAWYSFDLTLAVTPDELWAFYTRNSHAAFQVYVNDVLAGGAGSMSSPHRAVVSPTLIMIPAALLRAGDNRIDIRVAADGPGARVDASFVGPASVLRPVAERHLLFDVTVKQATVAAMVLFALLFAIIYGLRRQDTVFAAYGATIFLWALHVWHMTLATPAWVPEVIWGLLSGVLLSMFVVCGALTVNRFLGRHPRRLEFVLLAVTVGYAAIALFAGPLFAPGVMRAFNLYLGGPALLVLGGWSIWQLARAAVANATIERRLMLLCCGLVWIVGVRDYAGDLGLLGTQSYELYLPYTVSFVLLAFGSLILFRFARALRETEFLNRELEARVEQKAAELEANYARIRTFERDQALVAERSRIMRDMHDGIGGQLVAAIALASRPGAPRELDSLLHEALDDLRMMIDSLEATEADLLTALGMLRMRVTSRFAAAGLEFRWEVADVPRIPGFGPEQVLQVMRIVQEAFANILKHAGAHTITVRTATQPMSNGAPGVAIEIEDDGRGMQSSERVGGRGLANMRRRAQALGADLEIVQGQERGTCVVVRLPLTPVIAAA